MKRVALLMVLVLPTIVIANDAPHEQQKLARELGEKVQRFEIWTDEKGNVTGLIFINHQALTKTSGVKPGITDADILKLARFPKPSRMAWNRVPVIPSNLSPPSTALLMLEPMASWRRGNTTRCGSRASKPSERPCENGRSNRKAQ